MKKKMLISIALIFVMLLNYVVPFSLAYEVSQSEVKLTFNGNLYAAIKDNLIDAGVEILYASDVERTLILTQASIDSITSLKLSNYGIDDLTGLDIFKNVTYIDLSANELDAESNLDVLNSFNLTYLDLSSNQISDVSMITNINAIATLNLHNQRFNVIEIVEIDANDTSDQKTEATYELPQILNYGGTLKPEWLPETKYPNGGNKSPYVNWAKFDGRNITVVTGEKTKTTYTPYYGMTKVSVDVTDSTNLLFNSRINLFYITVSSDDRGIVFKDANLYKAVKEQLTKSQTVNTDLKKYTDGKNLYSRDYDEPLVLVISIDELINEIPSLVLSEKKIKDLTGLEAFVGVERELNLEGNYIESIEKILELKEKKIEEQEKLKARVKEQIAKIKENVDAIEEAEGEISEQQEVLKTTGAEVTKLQNEISKLEEEIKTLTKETETLSGKLPTYQAELTNKQTAYNNKNNEVLALKNELVTIKENISKASTTEEKEKLKAQAEAKEAQISAKTTEVDIAKTELDNAQKTVTDTENKISSNQASIETKTKDKSSKETSLNEKEQAVNAANQIIANDQIIIQQNEETLQVRLEKLYSTYKKSYKFARIATVELSTITDEEFEDLTYEDAKKMFEAQTSKLASIEKSLAKYESKYIIDEFDIPTVSNVTSNSGTANETTQTVQIENPIETYFKDFAKNHEYWNLTQIKVFLDKVKYMSTVLDMMTYCSNERMHFAKSDCYAEEYLNNEIQANKFMGESTTMLEDIKAKLTTIKSKFETSYLHQCTGTITTVKYGNDAYALAKKYSEATDEEINAYVAIPMLKVLNLRRNLIESIDGIEELNELKELYLGNNELVDVTGIDWLAFTQLEKLDLSYNSLREYKCFEGITSLKELDLSKNIIEGAFDLTLSTLPKLKYLNLSYNAINDIESIGIQLGYIARAAGYDDVASYLKDGNFDIRFYGQILTMKVAIAQLGKATYVDLPNIFKQAEELDSVRTSFGINSIFGNVTNDGKRALLDTAKLGEQTTQVTIVNTDSSNPGICGGTYCTVEYTVVANPTNPDDNNTTNNTVNNVVNNTVNNTENNVTNNTTNNTVNNNTNTVVDPTSFGYTVKGDNVTGVSPKTTVTNFTTKLTEDFKVVVVIEGEDGTQTVVDGYIGTGMIAVLYNEENTPVAAYEIVVKGDVNGDGLANAIDSNLIKAYRAEIKDLEGVYKEAADINQDGNIDAIDSRLLLYHRAEIDGYIL